MDYKRLGTKCDRVKSADKSAESAEWTECTCGKAENAVKIKWMCGPKDESVCLQVEFTVFKHMLLFLTLRSKHIS